MRIVEVTEETNGLTYDDGTSTPVQQSVQSVRAELVAGISIAPIFDPKRVLRGHVLMMQVSGRADVRLGGNVDPRSAENLKQLNTLRESVLAELADANINVVRVRVINLR